MKSLTLTAAALGLAIAATPAFAGDKAPTGAVSLSGLDLSTVEGQKILDQRIHRVAREICEVDKTTTGSRLPNRAVRDCYNKAVASAKQQVAEVISQRQRGG